jgi:hypothetical protein
MLPELMTERPAPAKRITKASKNANSTDTPSDNTMHGFLAKSSAATTSVVERDDGTMEMDA